MHSRHSGSGCSATPRSEHRRRPPAAGLSAVERQGHTDYSWIADSRCCALQYGQAHMQIVVPMVHKCFDARVGESY